MKRRDNSPKKKSTARKLLNNVYELIEKFGGNRKAWLNAIEKLQKRIAKAEQDGNGRIDLDQLPEHVREYIEYGVIPNRVQKKYIDEIERLRIKQLKEFVYIDELFDDYDEHTERPLPPVHISDVELNAIRSILDEYPLNPMSVKLSEYLDLAIESFGKDEVALQISVRYSKALDIVKKALTYRANTDRGRFWALSFKHIITGTQMTEDENAYASEFNEMLEGEDYVM